MKRVFKLSALLLLPALFISATASLITKAETANLINNPSVESGTTAPAGWQTNSWGNNASAFSYVQNGGSDGQKSLRVETSSYSGGDAKWYFNHVPVNPGTVCNFGDSYKSNVATNVTIQYLMSDGSYQYAWLGNPASSSTVYQRFSKSFTTPANVKSMSVFHILNKVGWLNTDGYSLTCHSDEPTTPPPAPQPAGELVANNSLESGTATPDSWMTNAWGTTKADFSYVTSGGDTGSRSVRVDVTSRTTGDAKWYFKEVAVSPLTACVFSDSYMSNVLTDVTVGYTMQDGSKQYVWLGSAPASSTGYKTFSKSFTTPANVKQMTVYHVLGKVGWLNTDSYSLKCAGSTPTQPTDPTKFNQPLISIEFDDGWKNAYNTGFPIVEEFGFRATQYIISQTTQWAGYMTDADIRDLSARGHDIGSHTVSHPHLPQLTDAQISAELRDSKSYLQNVLGGKPVNLFVTPYCESDARVRAVAMQTYSMLRNCEASANTKQNFDAYNIRSYIVLSTTTNAEIQAWINDAKANKSWIVLVYHEVQPTPDNPWAISPAALRSQLQLVKDSGVTVKKTGDALAEIQSQL